jgi:putative restriction endonuclease
MVAKGDWSKVVEIAVARFSGRAGNAEFTLQDLIRAELPRIIRETGSRGATPEATLRRELQELRDRGGIVFLGQGRYRLTVAPALFPLAIPSKCVFSIGSNPGGAQLDRFYRFGPQLLGTALRSVGQWILYQEQNDAGQRGFFAVAKVEQVIRDPLDPALYLALIEPGSLLEFGCDVPFDAGSVALGKALIRTISDEEFDRIAALGMVDAAEFLPRDDADAPVENKVREVAWLGPVERETALVSRKLRDRQFRKRVLDVYDRRCALTGMRLINGGGRAETQAAHVMSVEAGGPDSISNGIALSGTAHWLFDRGMVSLSDFGDILFSNKMSDLESVSRLIHPDRRARLPENEAVRPDTRFLAWHREWHGIAS